MERYIAHLNSYLDDYKTELKKRFIEINISYKRGTLSKEEFEKSKNEIHYYNKIVSNIAIFFSDTCEDIFGYFYELSCHLVPECFSSKDAYLILRFAVEKNYRNSLITYDEIPGIEKVQEYKFKSMSTEEVTSLVENNRINDLLDGTAKNVTDREIAFLKEFNENFDKFKVSIVDVKNKIKDAYEALDKFDSFEDIVRLNDALRALGVSDVCLSNINTHLRYKVNKKVKKEQEKSGRSINMRVVDKYLTVLANVKKMIAEQEKTATVEKIMKNGKQTVFEVSDTIMVNNATGKPAREEIDEISKYFSFPDDTYVENKIFFRDFFRVSSYLDSSFGITPKEAYQIIALVTKRNYEIAALTDSKNIVDLEALRRIPFKTITNAEVEHIFMNPELLKKFAGEVGLTKEEKKQHDEIEKYIDEFIQDYTDFCQTNDAFYLGFVCNFPNINLEDIINAYNSLKGLNVKPSIIDTLVTYFVNVFRATMRNSNEVFDMELNDTYLEMLVKDEEEREEIHDDMVRHNEQVERRIEDEIASMLKQEEKKEVKYEPIRYLTEKDVRDLKKYVRKFYDTYHGRLVSLPNYEELIKCVKDLERLEEDWYSISRFMSLVISELITQDSYLDNYDALITLVSYFIKYKVRRDYVDILIRKYKHLRGHSSDLVECMRESLDEIRVYDESLADDVEMLLNEISVSTKEDYDAIISLLEECMNSTQEFTLKTDYEYNLGLKKLGR